MPAQMSPGKTRLASFLDDQGSIEKLATGKLTNTKATKKLKITKNTLTVGTWMFRH